MPRRGENIHKRKDGRWEGRYKSSIGNNGKTIYSSVYGKTYSEVKSKMLSIFQTSELRTMHVGRERTFKEVLLLWQDANKIKHKGATEYKYDYLIRKHILPELGNIKISNITTFILNDFMNKKLQSGRLDRKGGLSPAYVRNIMIIVTSALQFAVNEQMCLPLKTPVYKPTSDKKELSILNVYDQKQFEECLISNLDNTKLGILISMHTGLRIGEVCALSWNDIDIERQIIHVRYTITRIKNSNPQFGTATIQVIDKPKTKTSIRDIPIPSRLLPLIKEVQQRSISRYVISENSTFVNPRTYEYRYHKILEEYGMPSINYHALRHTFATRCIEVGVDVKTLSEILGHSNVSITLNTYVHSSMDLKRAQIEKLSIISAQPDTGQKNGQ